MAKSKRKHHYLPKFYLKGFTNQIGELFVLTLETEEITKQGKNGTFHIPYFYRVDFSKYKKRDPESTKRIKASLGIENVDTSEVKEYPDMIEDLLSESENFAAKIIPKLINGEEISNSEKAELSMFIALMYTRTPAFYDWMTKTEQQMMDHHIKQTFSSKEKAKSVYNELVKEGKDMKVSFEKVFETFSKSQYRIEVPKELNIRNMLTMAPAIDTILQKKTWLILEAPEGSTFITNDNPVFLEHPNLYKNSAYGVGFETPDVQIFFPLSKECLLVVFDTPDNGSIIWSKIPEIEVQKLNQIIFRRSNKYVISRDDDLITELKN